MKVENDWTSEQVGRYPDRLRGYCSFNPLKEYALHFGNCVVDYLNPAEGRMGRVPSDSADRRGIHRDREQSLTVFVVRRWISTRARVRLKVPQHVDFLSVRCLSRGGAVR